LCKIGHRLLPVISLNTAKSPTGNMYFTVTGDLPKTSR